MHVLLTNDDGIDAPGLRALHRTLRGMESVERVTVAAPAEDRSGIGRARSNAVDVHEHERGYAVEGTPADCVAFGLRGLDERPGVVVSGCNDGPNVGAYVLGRSGTVGAAVEAGFLGVPAIAVSAYHPTEFFPHQADEFDFSLARRVTDYLLDRTLGSGVFDSADLLNVNVPTEGDAEMRVTRPLADYDTEVERDDDGIHLRDRFWSDVPMGENPYYELIERRDAYPEWSDRRAMLDGDISVSVLSAPHSVEEHEAIDEIVVDFEGRAAETR